MFYLKAQMICRPARPLSVRAQGLLGFRRTVRWGAEFIELGEAAMRQWLRNNGLSLALGLLFLFCVVGHSIAGWLTHNEEKALHGSPEITYADYLASGDFHESLAENWESEFLQMVVFVLLTVFLFQKGSSESKDPQSHEEVDEESSGKHDANAPWPVRRGGMALRLYSHSLSLALFALFVVAFALHIVGGWEAYCDDLAEHEVSPVGMLRYVISPRFWFESLENWQSEFLAIFTMVILSIFLRERGSPQSKPVAAPHNATGD
jgi:hypothetical protein